MVVRPLAHITGFGVWRCGRTVWVWWQWWGGVCVRGGSSGGGGGGQRWAIAERGTVQCSAVQMRFCVDERG